MRIYAETMGARVGHPRTKGGTHEVDLVVEFDNARCIAIEVKLADAIGDRDVRHLNWLAGELGNRLIDRIVLNTGPSAYRRQDGVAVVPLALLGP